MKICNLSALLPFHGRVAMIEGQQVALFLVPEQGVFAIQNWDPIGRAHVLARGIVGDVGGELCVASPLYKQHFSLRDGRCIEQPDKPVKVWQVAVKNDVVWLD